MTTLRARRAVNRLVTEVVDAYRAAVMVDSPAIYLRMGESAGATSAVDEIGGNSGTYTGPTVGSAVGPVAGRTAAVFDGVNDVVTTPYAPFVAGSGRTFEIWAYQTTPAASFSTIFSSDSTPNGADFTVQTSTGQIRWYADTQAGSTSWASMPLNTWKYLVLTFNDATDAVELYLDGASLGVQTHTMAYTATPGNVRLGLWTTAGVDPWTGRLAEFAVYPTILSATRIAAHYTAAHTPLLMSDTLQMTDTLLM